MTHKERVWAAIHHQQSDCVPKGESWIDGRLANRLMGTDYPTDYQHFEDYLVYCITNPDELISISDKVMEYEIEKAKLFLDAGADAIFMADDIAFNTGVFLPPQLMDRLVFPYYEKVVREIKAYRDVPVFAHSDGDLNSVMHRYVELGFDGIQSLQPSANMDIRQLKRQYGDKLCLWGNIDLNHVMCFASAEEVRQAVRDTIDAAWHDGGFILSTCNSMVDCIPPENVLAMMEASLN